MIKEEMNFLDLIGYISRNHVKDRTFKSSTNEELVITVDKKGELSVKNMENAVHEKFIVEHQFNEFYIFKNLLVTMRDKDGKYIHEVFESVTISETLLLAEHRPERMQMIDKTGKNIYPVWSRDEGLLNKGDK